MTGQVLVRFFASARDAAGVESGAVECPENGMAEQELREVLGRAYPGLSGVHGSLRVARNFQYMAAGERVFPNDEVALIPPVSGG